MPYQYNPLTNNLDLISTNFSYDIISVLEIITVWQQMIVSDWIDVDWDLQIDWTLILNI